MQTQGQTQPLIRSWPLWVLMLLSLALATPLAYLLNIRFDEAYTLNTTLDGPVYAVKQALGFGQQAPLYFLLISLWRTVDPSIFFARMFSVLCFPLIVWTAAEVSKRYIKNLNPLITAAIVLVHQQVVWNALDIRLYAMMTLLSGLLLVFFYDGFLAEQTNKRARMIYTILAVVSLYTQYYIGFQLFAGAVALLACRKWRPLGQYILHMAIAGVIFIPMILIVAGGQMGVVTEQLDAKLPLDELINGLYQRIIPLMIPVNAIEHETLKRWLARGVIAGIALLFSAKLIRERKDEDIALGMTITVMALFSLLAYSVVGDSLIQQRHLSGMILPLVLIPLSAVSFLRSKPLLDGWVALLIGLSVFYLFTYYKPLAKPGDFERMGKFVMQNEKPNQPVLIFHADAILPFRYYYKGQNKMLPLPQENGTDAWNPRNNILKDEAQILNVINSQPGDPNEFWLVYDGWCAQGTIKYNCDVLESVIDKYFVVEEKREFLPPATVRLLKRK